MVGMMKVPETMSVVGMNEHGGDNEHSVRYAGWTPHHPLREDGAEGPPRSLPEPSPAPAMSSPGVLLEVGQLAEGLLAVGAVVGFDTQMDAQVLGQV